MPLDFVAQSQHIPEHMYNDCVFSPEKNTSKHIWTQICSVAEHILQTQPSQCSQSSEFRTLVSAEFYKCSALTSELVRGQQCVGSKSSFVV